MNPAGKKKPSVMPIGIKSRENTAAFRYNEVPMKKTRKIVARCGKNKLYTTNAPDKAHSKTLCFIIHFYAILPTPLNNSITGTNTAIPINELPKNNAA